jgi:hypothetical protein
MILILSSRTDEITTSVIEWLNYFGAESKVVYYDDELQFNYANNGELFLIRDGDEIKFSELSGFWHRTAFHTFEGSYKHKTAFIQSIGNNALVKTVNRWLEVEERKLFKLMSVFASKVNYLSTPDNYDINRVQVLIAAKELGLQVPDWIIATNKSYLEEFYLKNKAIITKPIGWNVFFNIENNSYILYTKEIKKDMLEAIPDVFPPSFFQKLINKKLEIRIFFLLDRFYCMACYPLTQNVNVDLRLESGSLNVREIPFILPVNIREKLVKLLDIFKLKTASIDMIYGDDNEYYFLEINPTGQFSYLNNKCNYHLGEKIAKFLNA